jgi:Helix-turn-helix domain
MAFTTIQTTQRDFLINYLRGTGRELSSAQASSLYGIKNLRARISELRQDGYRVRTRVNTEGRTAYAVSRRMQGQL